MIGSCIKTCKHALSVELLFVCSFENHVEMEEGRSWNVSIEGKIGQLHNRQKNCHHKHVFAYKLGCYSMLVIENLHL